MVRNQNWESIGENVYSRFITISGQVENTWVKAPKRIIESINLKNTEPENGLGTAGLIIIDKDGGEVPEIIDTECETWLAKDSED